MKYYCVNGGCLFPFRIRKITPRDVQLFANYDVSVSSFHPDAEENLRAVQNACTQLSKQFGSSYSTDFCLYSRAAYVSIYLPLWQLHHDEWRLLQQLRPHLAGISAHPFALGLKILFRIKYFGNETEHIEKDLAEIYQRYTDK